MDFTYFIGNYKVKWNRLKCHGKTLKTKRESFAIVVVIVIKDFPQARDHSITL